MFVLAPLTCLLLAAAAPVKAPPERIDTGWLGAHGAIYLVDAHGVTKLDASGRQVARFPASGLTFDAYGADEVRGHDDSTELILDAALRVRSRCVLPDGWSWREPVWPRSTLWWVSRGKTLALDDLRRCKLRRLGAAFDAKVAKLDAWVAFSRDFRFVAFQENGNDPSDRGDAQVFTWPGLKPVRVDEPSFLPAKWGPSIEAVRDDGTIVWVGPGECRNLESPDLKRLEGPVFAELDLDEHAVRVEQLGTVDCCLQRGDAQVLASISYAELGVDETFYPMIAATRGAVLILGASRIWRLDFPRGAHGFDHRRPTLREITPH